MRAVRDNLGPTLILRFTFCQRKFYNYFSGDMMKFFKWIKSQGGPRAVAKMIDTESPTIKAWLNKRASPKALVMQKLVKLGKGAFSYDDIINDTKK